MARDGDPRRSGADSVERPVGRHRRRRGGDHRGGHPRSREWPSAPRRMHRAPRRGVVLAGAPNQGKELHGGRVMRHGAGYVTDEVVELDLDSGRSAGSPVRSGWRDRCEATWRAPPDWWDERCQSPRLARPTHGPRNGLASGRHSVACWSSSATSSSTGRSKHSTRWRRSGGWRRWCSTPFTRLCNGRATCGSVGPDSESPCCVIRAHHAAGELSSSEWADSHSGSPWI